MRVHNWALVGVRSRGGGCLCVHFRVCVRLCVGVSGSVCVHVCVCVGVGVNGKDGGLCACRCVCVHVCVWGSVSVCLFVCASLRVCVCLWSRRGSGLVSRDD